MEPFAVNHTTVTKALFTECYAAVFSKRRQKLLYWCGAIFSAFGLILVIVQAKYAGMGMLSMPALFSGIFVLIWAALLPRTERNRKYKRFRRRFGESARRTVSFYEGYLTVAPEGHESADIDYTEIAEERESASAWMLICKNHTGIMLEKGGFETGSPADVRAAIERARQQAADMARLAE